MVKVMLPGFIWTNLDGDKIVLRRAIVDNVDSDIDEDEEKKDEHRRRILKPAKKNKTQEVTKRHIFRKNITG